MTVEVLKLDTERKHLTNVLKMVAYQAESDLLRLLAPYYPRSEDEGRTLLQSAFNSAADIEATREEPYDGVVEQYREEVAQNSMHLKVYADRRWVIDHVDEDNPDLGREVPHFFNDHPVWKFLKTAGAVAGVAACVAVAGVAIGAVAKGLSEG